MVMSNGLICVDRDGSRHVVWRNIAAINLRLKDGVNLTFTAYFMTAIVAGWPSNRQSSWSDEGVLVHKNINMAWRLHSAKGDRAVIKGADNARCCNGAFCE